MGRPSRLEQKKWMLKAAGNEVMQWKMKLRTAFGLERIPDVPRPQVPRLAESTNSASATAEFPVPVTESTAMAVDPSRIPLPKTPDVKRSREVTRTSGGTPYFGDTDMHTPPRGSTQFDESRDLADAVESDDEYDTWEAKADPYESPRHYIQQLSLEDSDRNRSNVLEVRTHAPLDKIAVFEGKRNRSEDSLQWLKRFIYEMKGTRMPNDSWCEPFSLSLGKAAKSWFRQLPKKTQLKWSLLSSAFLDYYCSQYDQTAQTRYFSARRKENEHICDFLLRLNGFARAATIQYEAGGPQAVSHVEHFLLHCGDDAVMDQLYPQRLSDNQRVEKIINQKLLGDKRKKQRDRTATGRVRESRRDDGNRRSESKRSDGYRERRRDVNATDVKTVVDVAAKIANAESPWPMPALKTSEPPSMNVAPVTKPTSTTPLAKGATRMPQLSRRPTQALITSTLERQPSRNVRRTGEARAVLARTRLRDPLDDLSRGDILHVAMNPANVGGTARAALVVRTATMPTSAGGDASSASKCTTRDVVSSSNDSRNLTSS
ncbi:hypothetical protein PF004_g23195 [Phytophthora fragariae]|uniref:Retrotransposon gag domain-containing protein n=1 Tax=Phytophthora fragariae TaxID=53985 RepID=A0A6G0MY46_9STRA|nr:hypothetical protein PF004_g23195 [Phytophthora fragariae]